MSKRKVLDGINKKLRRPSYIGKFIYRHKGKKLRNRKNYMRSKRRKFIFTWTECHASSVTDFLKGWIAAFNFPKKRSPRKISARTAARNKVIAAMMEARGAKPVVGNTVEYRIQFSNPLSEELKT